MHPLRWPHEPSDGLVYPDVRFHLRVRALLESFPLTRGLTHAMALRPPPPVSGRRRERRDCSPSVAGHAGKDISCVDRATADGLHRHSNGRHRGRSELVGGTLSATCIRKGRPRRGSHSRHSTHQTVGWAAYEMPVCRDLRRSTTRVRIPSMNPTRATKTAARCGGCGGSRCSECLSPSQSLAFRHWRTGMDQRKSAAARPLNTALCTSYHLRLVCQSADLETDPGLP